VGGVMCNEWGVDVIDWTGFLPSIFSAVGALISAWAAYLLLRVTREMNIFNKRASSRTYMALLMENINYTNSVVVGDEKNIAIMKSLGSPEPQEALLLGRKEWLIFMWLNELQLTYVGLRDGLLESSFAAPSLDQLIPILMRDDTAYRLVRTRGYDKEFVEFCERMREKVTAKP
jgi:hypothetical protein